MKLRMTTYKEGNTKVLESNTLFIDIQDSKGNIHAYYLSETNTGVRMKKLEQNDTISKKHFINKRMVKTK